MARFRSTIRMEKIAIFLKSGQNWQQAKKNAKISTSKFNLKVKNIYIKPLLELKNSYNLFSLFTAYLGENIRNCLSKKHPKMSWISVGFFIISKYHNELPRFAQWNSALCLVLIKVCRGQLWKGKQNKYSDEKMEGNCNGVKLFKIIKSRKHLAF